MEKISLFDIDIIYNYVTQSFRNLSLDVKETQNNDVKIFIDVMTSPMFVWRPGPLPIMA